MSSGYQNALIDLMRHGAIAGEPGLYGWHDVPVNETGRLQMRQSTGIDLQYQQVYSSPLQRCHEFAREYCTRHNLLLQTHQALKEMNFGNWDGKTFPELQEQWSQLEAFWANPANVTPPNGEALEVFRARINAVWAEIIEASRNTHTLVVTHAGVIRMILGELLHVDWRSPDFYQRLRIDYGSVTRISILYAPDGEIYPQIRFIGRPSPIF